MNIYERIAEIDTTLEAETAKEVYSQREAELIKIVGDSAMGAEISCSAYGFGHIVGYRGTALDNLIVDIEFASGIRSFSLSHILTYGKFARLEDTMELGGIWFDAALKHTDLSANLKLIKRQQDDAARAAAKQAEEEKRAEAKYQAAKARAIADFNAWTTSERPQSTADEFYFALGWLAKHAGTVSAALPDYLADDFKTYFGSDVPCRIVDSKKRGPAGWQSQWAKSFSVSLKQIDTVPGILSKYLNPKGKAVTDTDFVLDLIDLYGFQFGKTQDVEKIRSKVPTAHISFFENGLI